MAINQHSIFLSRHGESDYMLKQLLGGDPALTAKGRAYAQQLPEIILPLLSKDCFGSLLPVPVLTSTLQRTIQTAAHLPFPQQRLAALDEINAGICEHMSYEQVQHNYPAVAEARARDKLGYRYPQGESYIDLVQRLWPVVHHLEQRQSPVVVVAHQAVLRVLLGLLQRRPLQDMPRMSIPLHTVMHLTPAAAGAGAASSSPYNMTLIQADLPQDHAATPAATTAPAAAAVATKALAMTDAVPCAELSAHSRSSSCSSAFGEDGAANPAWPIDTMHSWSSCNSEMQELVVPPAVLAGQQA